jgi:hypothetical protein
VAIILVTMGQYYVSSLAFWPRLAWVARSSSCIDLTLNVPYGNGVLLWFEVDEFDAAIARAVEMKANIFMAAIAIARLAAPGRSAR